MPRVHITEEKIARFLNGQESERIPVGVMPLSLKRVLRSKVRIIRLYSGTAQKIAEEHSLLPDHFMLIPVMMEDAWVGADAKRHITFLYYEEMFFHKAFKLVVKSNRQRRELIVSTFHKVDAEHIRRIKRRCAKVRDGYV